MNAKLYICPTPIGNLGDITKRTLEILQNCDCVYAEDTRKTLQLLNSFSIKKSVFRLDENCMKQKACEVLRAVQSGKNVAYCTDAGMPGVSDPGLSLISDAYENDVSVEVLPGVSAVTTAYVASGFCNTKFLFAGFMPRKNSERKQAIVDIQKAQCTAIFYESPKRLVDSLRLMSEAIPQTKIAICRELTKMHEEVWRGVCIDAYNEFSSRDSIKGEIAIVLDFENSANSDKGGIDPKALAKILINSDVSTKSASKVLAKVCGISKGEAYALVCALKKS